MSGAVQSFAGLIGPHGIVRQGNQQRRFDGLVGTVLVLNSRDSLIETELGVPQQTYLDAIRAKRVVVNARESAVGSGALVDLDMKFIPYMQQRDIQTMLVRPDFYL